MRVGLVSAASIRVKALVVVFALTTTLVVFLATYFPAKHLQASRAATVDDAMAIARLMAHEVEPAIAFDDRETAREVFAAAAEDEDLRGIALFTADGREIFGTGRLIGGPPPARATKQTVVFEPTSLRVVAPVVSREGPRGTLVLEVSTRHVDEERRTIQRSALVVGFAALVVGFVAAWLISRSIGRRLGTIAGATRAVAAGDLTVPPVEDGSADEVGQLARDFNKMSANLRALVDRMREASARETQRLDSLVRLRTTELDARNGDMRVVLDNVSQGLLLIDGNARLVGEHSAVVERWFGAVPLGTLFGDLLARVDPSGALAFRMNWDQVESGFLPLELALDQLPRTLRDGACVYEVQYNPLMKGAELDRVLIVISDATERRAAEQAESEQREIVRAFECIAADRTGFLEFLDDARSQVARLCGDARPGVTEVRRCLHTLKGNSSLNGLSGLASFCHEVEDAIAESGADLNEKARAELRARWNAFERGLAPLLGERSLRSVVVETREIDLAVQALAAGRPREEIARYLDSWRSERVSDRYARHAVQARSMMQRLAKGDLDVVTDAGEIRLSREKMAPFWAAFSHAVRNVVAHGIESPRERAEAGKSEAGALFLSAHRLDDRVVLEIADDGRGIDWDSIEAKARAIGLPCQTPQDLEAALFHDGLSTRREADGMSGRGLGMGVLRAECERLGGRMSVLTARGAGTRLVFSFLADAVGASDAASGGTNREIDGASHRKFQTLFETAKAKRDRSVLLPRGDLLGMDQRT